MNGASRTVGFVVGSAITNINVQEIIERLVNVERFSMATLCEAVWPLIEDHPDTRAQNVVLREQLGDHFGEICEVLLRNVFLIELVKVPKIESTKVRCRWYEQLGHDSRRSTFADCLTIAAQLLTELQEWLRDERHEELIRIFFEEGILPYEVPLDYRELPARDDALTLIHRPGNLGWIYDDLISRTLSLRRFLRNPDTSPDANFFRRVLDDKIKIKTYLTDRAQTGPYKTNREKRWEAHPKSPQFATRATCISIEYKLITQLCGFEGFPPAARELLQRRNILPDRVDTFRCPVTQDPLSFALFRDALLNPRHGKSDFQVGHLNPLKLDEPGTDAIGHTADNTSWISGDGNRIQGAMSLSNVRQLLRRISANYEHLNLV